MTKHQSQVRDFMLAAGQGCPKKPSLEPTADVQSLRYCLIEEELKEFGEAQANCDRIGVADALGDLLIVVYGAAVAYGFDMEPILDEIHRSNMTKFIDGHRREDGKWIKGPSYSPANLGPIIKKQMEG